MIIVYSYYVLDIIHKGHLEMLRNCRAVAGADGLLIVGILTDEAAMEVKPKPTLCFEERIEIARSIKYIDLVVVQRTYSPVKNVRMLKPDILMESSSHDAGRYELDKIGCKIITIPYFPDHSSTRIKKDIRIQ